MLYVDTFGAFGGVGRCSIELLPFLSRRLGDVTVVGRSHVIDSYAKPLPATDRLHFRNLERPRLHPGAWALRALGKAQPRSSAFTHALLDRAQVGGKADRRLLINYPQSLTPPERAYEFNVFIHDLNWRRFPDGDAAAIESLDQRCQEWVRQARRVFTNSHFTRDEVIELYGKEASQVVAAPLAPPSLPAASGPETAKEKLAALGLTANGYFFYPSVHGYHKGHDVLAAALASAASSTLPVVITAPIRSDEALTPGGNFMGDLIGQLDRLRRAGRIISLPFLPWNEVLMLASACRAYVLPSRFEGFGFPLAEAMALGKLSICSEIPAFREIIERYGGKIRAETFPCGEAEALRDLLVMYSGATGEQAESVRPDLSSSWGWADTAEAIAVGMGEGGGKVSRAEGGSGRRRQKPD